MSTYYGSVLSDEEEDIQSRKSVDKWIYRLLLVLMGLMPLIVLANVEEVISPLISNNPILQSGFKGELFTHYKALFLLTITVIVSLMFLVKIFFLNGVIRKTHLNYVLGAFVLVIVASTIMSPNITSALNGANNRSDGAISWLCYISLMFIAMNIEYPKNIIRSVVLTMMPFVYINLYIITMNFYGNDLLQKGWMQKLVSSTLPEGASIDGGSILLGTLNQWNYMSGMFAIMTVIYLAWAVTSKKWIETAAGAITASASIAVMFMSLSTSGFLTVVVVMPFIILAMFRKDNIIQSVVGFVGFLVIATPIFHILAEENPRVWAESFGFMLNENPYLEAIKPNEPSEVIYKPSFENVAYAAEQSIELPVLPESGVSAGTGRVYIWQKTISSLEGPEWLVGKGLDTIMYYFPHYNIDARAGLRTETTIVDKPHSLYVGTLYGTGIIGLAALLALALMTFWASVKLFIQKNVTVLVLGFAWIAFLIQALFNDSLVGITGPMFVIGGIFMGLVLSDKENNNQLEG